MNTEQIDSLLNSFFISKEDLSKRQNFKEFANSLSDVIIDEFAQNYLLNNPYLNVYLAHTDGSMLLKKIKIFLSYVLSEDVTQEYVKRVHFIGSVHYSIKLEPAKVSYGFWALNEIILKMSEVNEVVKENRSLISKLLKFVEHLMNDGYYIQKDKKLQNLHDKRVGLNVQNEIYQGFNQHTLNMKKIDLAIQKSDVKYLENIDENASICTFGQMLKRLAKESEYEYVLGVDIEEIYAIHEEWHNQFSLIKNHLKVQNNRDLNTEYKHLENLTVSLKTMLDKTLKNSLEDGQLALDSGIRAMRKTTELFYDKNFQDDENKELKDILEKIIENTFLSELRWAIEKIEIKKKNSFSSKFGVVKQMRHYSQDIFIAIELKEMQNSDYLIEMINMLLEVLDLHISVKERELSLINFADKAEHANKSKDMFLANMSHELRTPLNAITGFSQILMMKKDTPDSVKKYVEKINIAGNNLLDLVNTILDFAKLEAGKMQFNPSLSNISDILNELQILVWPMADKKNISLKMPNIISLNLYIDKTLFKQVLINLLTNAIKFTAKDGHVELSMVYDADVHEYIFEVKDSGVGLSSEESSRLFQAFSQVENSYQKEHQGTGLGLMISKKIIEDLHNGKIWIESVKGEGSSFYVSMPTPMLESHTYHVKSAPEGSFSVLIVEDSESYQKILIEHLEKTHNLTITDTINKAKDLLSKESYDFIILDFFLIDGISSKVLQFMEEEGIKIPTIVISAEDEINISSSLAGSSNLECIVNKSNIEQICASLRGEVV